MANVFAAVAGESRAGDKAALASMHWAFQPLKTTRTSQAAQLAPRKATLDDFIARRLREARLTPGREADHYTLIRRVAFVLTGLPPTPEEIDAFVSDKTPGAYERMVTRYVDSAHSQAMSCPAGIPVSLRR